MNTIKMKLFSSIGIHIKLLCLTFATRKPSVYFKKKFKKNITCR